MLYVVIKVSQQKNCQNVDYYEEARSLQLLLFPYANREGSYFCTMRLGNKICIEMMTSSSHTSLVLCKKRTSNMKPSYCESFSTDNGTNARSMSFFDFSL